MEKQSIVSLYKKNQGYLTKKHIPGRAMYYELLDKGLVQRVKNGLFYLEDADVSPCDDRCREFT